MIFKFREGSGYPKELAQPVGERLEKIRKKNGGKLKPIYMIEDAQSKESPLHSIFEWDDSQAAHLHRIQQARQIVSAIVCEVEAMPDVEMRYFVSVTMEDDGERSYIPILTAMAVPELRDQILSDAFRDLEAFQKKYKHLIELSEVIKVIDRTIG